MLDYLSDADYKLLAHFKSGPQKIHKITPRVRYLLDLGLIEPCSTKAEWVNDDEIVIIPVKYRLSIKGENALSAYRKMDEQGNSKTDKDRQKDSQCAVDVIKSDKKSILVNIFIGVASGVVLLAIEHFWDILAFFQRVLHNISLPW